VEDLLVIAFSLIYLIGHLLSCLAWFLSVPGIFVAFHYIRYKNDETKKAAWITWAQTNGFTFIPDKWRLFSARGSSLQGEYLGCSILLESFGRNQRRSRSTYTRLIVSPNQSPGEEVVPPQFELGQPRSAEEIVQLLISNPGFKSRGEIRAQRGGEKLIYEQEWIETDPNYLQALLELTIQLLGNYSKILALGGEAVPGLQSLANNYASPLQWTARQLLVDIGEETCRRLKPLLADRFCTRCLTCCAEHELKVSWLRLVNYCGCRTCGQSRQFLKGPLIAVLDSQMETKRTEQPEGWYINWLQRREPFDFSRVEIVQATDEEVERFAVQVGNDTDKWRKPRYKQMSCVVSAQCWLSENTLRILERMFGEVNVEALS
jgi:hypothetical protein